MLPSYQEFINNSEFEFIYDSEVKFYLYENGEPIDEVMDLSLESAIEYFKDNFEGEYVVSFQDGKFKIKL
jgi:hypothetical protein